MKQWQYAFLSIVAIYGLVAGCTVPPLKGPQGETASAEPVGGCIQCHSPGEVEAGNAFEMHTIHFAALAEETRCAMCHPAETGEEAQVTNMAGVSATPVAAQTAAKMEPYYLSWATSDYLDNEHNQHQIGCEGCHDNALRPASPPMAQCVKCHGSYAQVAQLPYATVYNPHDSHMGEIECTLCHKGHATFELYCNECHQFDD